MGLDITAYEHVELLTPMSVDLANELDLDLSYTDQVLLYDCVGLVDGIYRHNEKTYEFRAGSYGGYNEWRDKLAMFAHNVPAEYIWQHEDAYKGKPFVSLIHFSDCDGVLGPAVCASLAHDFATYHQRAGAEPDPWWIEGYRHWRRAFELAKDGGCVRFH